MSRFKIEKTDISKLVLLKKNARFMDSKTFDRLVDNIKTSKGLSSVPLCIKKPDGKYEVISGNHRVKAAKKAGLAVIDIMYVLEEEISYDERLALQISHNSISGQDDEGILAEILKEIRDDNFLEYSFIDIDSLNKEKISYDIINPKNDFFNFSFSFIDIDALNFSEICEKLDGFDCTGMSVFPMECFDNFSQVLSDIQIKYGIKSYGRAVYKMASLASEYLKNNKD